MGVEIIGTPSEAVLTCNTSGRAFGPVHHSVAGRATDELRGFVAQLDADARDLYARGALELAYRSWSEGL